MMTRVHFLAVLIFCRISSLATSEPTTWLIQGDLFADEEATSRLIQLDTHKSYSPVNTRAEVSYETRDGKLINCVIAAAVHQHGHVHVVEGGYNTRKVRIRYTTENGRPDVFFVLVQAAKREPVSVEGNVARSTRLDIVHDPIGEWTVEEQFSLNRRLLRNTQFFFRNLILEPLKCDPFVFLSVPFPSVIIRSL